MNSNSEIKNNSSPCCSTLIKECSSPLYRVPIFLSYPSKLNLIQQQFVDTIILKIKESLLFPRTLPISEQYPETPLLNIRRMMLSSYGFVALDLSQRQINILQNNLGEEIDLKTLEGSPFVQLEPAMAFQHGLPLLLIREKGVEQTGIWSFGIGPFLILEWNSALPLDNFFTNSSWLEIFQNWTSQVRNGFYLQTQPSFQYRCNKDIVN